MRALHLLTVAALLSVSPAAFAAPSARDRAEAKARAAEGRKAIKNKRWADAIAALKKAERLEPTPTLAVDLAQALVGAGKLVEASRTLSVVADGAEATPAARKARAAAKKALADLKARVPTIKVTVTGAPFARVSTLVDGIEVDGSTEISVNPGDHTIGASAAGFVNTEKELHVDEGAHAQLALALRPIGPPRSADDGKKTGSRVPGVVVTTIGGAGLLAGGIFGGLAFSTTSSAKSLCTGNACPPSAADEIARSKTYGNVSTAMFIGGGAVALTGIILLVVAPGGGGSRSDDAGLAGRSARLFRLAPWAGPGGGGVGATGSF